MSGRRQSATTGRYHGLSGHDRDTNRNIMKGVQRNSAQTSALPDTTSRRCSDLAMTPAGGGEDGGVPLGYKIMRSLGSAKDPEPCVIFPTSLTRELQIFTWNNTAKVSGARVWRIMSVRHVVQTIRTYLGPNKASVVMMVLRCRRIRRRHAVRR